MRFTRSRSKKKLDHQRLYIIGFVFTFLVILSLFVLVKSYWAKKSTLSLAIPAQNGDILIAVFNSETGKISSLEIPKDTEILVSKNLGVWKAGSLWKLALQEKDEHIFPRSLMKTFYFPVKFYAEEQATGFVEGGFFNIVKSLLSIYKTNMSLLDKISLASFSLTVNNIDKLDIDAKSEFLTKTKLSDGEEGFVKKIQIPTRILVAFSDPQISKDGIKVKIIDATGQGVATEVAKIVSTLGAKVTSIKLTDKEDMDCLVASKEREIARKFAEILNCAVKIENIDSSDVEIKIGPAFAKKF